MMKNFLFTICLIFGITYGKSYGYLSTNLCTGQQQQSCGNFTDPRCQQISDGYCGCIDPSLNLDVAIMLDATKSEAKKVWDNVISVAVNYFELVASKEPNVNVTAYIFGDNEINAYRDSISLLSIDYLNYSSATTCNALQTIGRNLQNTFHDNRVIFYVAWKTPSDITNCNLTLLNGTMLYTFILNDADLSAFQAKVESSGMQYTQAGYCDATCVNFLKNYSGNMTGYNTMAAAFASDWICQSNFSLSANTSQTTSTTSTTKATTSTTKATTSTTKATTSTTKATTSTTKATTSTTMTTPEKTILITTIPPLGQFTTISSKTETGSKNFLSKVKHLWKKFLSIF